ncbi:MAG: preprotein translocase subunit SecE [Oscillospiraceae bacterium]|nr:preprotein translocase subunit SecE [Oscillospiraceae bacterium]
MADKKAVNNAAAKPEEAKTEKKAKKADNGKKKVPFTTKVKNFFGRIIKYFRDTKSELKKVVWPSKKDIRTNTITVLVVVAIAAVSLILIDLAFGGIIQLLIGA